MNIFVQSDAINCLDVDPQDSNGSLFSENGVDHFIALAKASKKRDRNQSKARRPIDIYVSLYSDLQHKLIIHTSEE
jgi:hypothetical protein